MYKHRAFVFLVPLWLFGLWFGIVFPLIVKGWSFLEAFLLMFSAFAFSFLAGAYPFMTGRLPRERGTICLAAIPIASGVIGVLLGGFIEDFFPR
jgi:hypothetical protein